MKGGSVGDVEVGNIVEVKERRKGKRGKMQEDKLCKQLGMWEQLDEGYNGVVALHARLLGMKRWTPVYAASARK